MIYPLSAEGTYIREGQLIGQAWWSEVSGKVRAWILDVS